MMNDVAAERAVLSGLARYGCDLYFDICDFVKPSTFVVESNQMIYKCIQHTFKQDENARIDVPTIFSAAKDLGYSHILERKDEAVHLQSILAFPVEKENVKRFAAKIRKLEIARLIHEQMELGKQKMLEVTGTEPIADIVNSAERIVFDFTSLLDSGESDAQPFATDTREWLEQVMNNPVKQIGYSIGFKEYEKAIGGGPRKGSLTVMGARSKGGKSFFCINAGLHLAKQGIKTLYLDSEMTLDDQRSRVLGNLSGCDSNSIQTGQFQYNEYSKKEVFDAVNQLDALKDAFYYKSINGFQLENILSHMRRWVQKTVGLNADGTAKDCVIFYDYLKLMDQKDVSDHLREFQILGFMMTALHNFAVRYNIPIIITLQLNRDGLTEETAAVASGSDRIIHLCGNFSILKEKSDEEIAEDGANYGNRKIVVVLTRHGGGLERGDYIHVQTNFDCGRMHELSTKFKTSGDRDGNGLRLNNDDGNDIPFE